MKGIKILILITHFWFAPLTFGQTNKHPTYDKAYNEISQMLTGEKPKNVKRALFLVENAYHGGKLNYKNYCLQLDSIKLILKSFVKDKNISQNKMAYNFAIFSYMKEPSQYNNNKAYNYGFDDYLVQKDWSTMFITKLLDTKKGNCHSLPLMYKVLANEVGADAHLAFAPLHMYIKHKDNKNQWINLELTSGTFPTDGFLMNETGITAEAIKNEIYMHPLDEQQTIAYCMEYLGITFFKQYGADDFVIKSCDNALQFHPNLINAIILKANVYEFWYKEATKKGLQKSNPVYVKGLEKILTELYKRMDNLGYKDVTTAQYAQWIKQSEEEKERQLKARK